MLHGYTKINKDIMFSLLSSKFVYDNAQGNASSTRNKTSIYLFDGALCLSRMCNISLSNIDGNGDMTEIPDNIDDFSVGGRVLTEMICSFEPISKSRLSLRMNHQAYTQLVHWWYEQKNTKEPSEFKSFLGVRIEIDNSISDNQDTII